MAVENVLVPIFRGEYVTVTLTVSSQDITGWAMSFIVRPKGATTEAAITKSTGGYGVALTDPENGVATITLTNTDTDLPEGRYDFSIARTDAGSQAVLTNGAVEIKKNTVLGTRT